MVVSSERTVGPERSPGSVRSGPAGRTPQLWQLLAYSGCSSNVISHQPCRPLPPLPAFYPDLHLSLLPSTYLYFGHTPCSPTPAKLLQNSPCSSSSPCILASPYSQNSPCSSSSPGILASPYLQNSPCSSSSPGILASPYSQNYPCSSSSPGIFPSHRPSQDTHGSSQ
jgi:hypothetical protein